MDIAGSGEVTSIHGVGECRNLKMKERYRKKVKVPPVQATKPLRVGRGIAPPFLRPRH